MAITIVRITLLSIIREALLDMGLSNIPGGNSFEAGDDRVIGGCDCRLSIANVVSDYIVTVGERSGVSVEVRKTDGDVLVRLGNEVFVMHLTSLS